MRAIIVAHGVPGRAIGLHGDMPWGHAVPRDLQRFKKLTQGSTVIMGRLTLESIGRPLPGRENIVVSTTETAGIHPDITQAESIEAALALSSRKDQFFIGGERIYQVALEIADYIFATEIQYEFAGDRFFPQLVEDEWQETEREHYPSDERNKFDMDFVTYIRARQ